MPAALGALAGVDLVVVALAALLLAFAAVALFRPFILGALAQLPLVGGWAQSNVESMLLRVAASAVGWIQASIAPLTWAVDRVWAERHYVGLANLNALQTAYNVLAAQAGAINWIIRAYVPDQVRAVLALAVAHADQLAAALDAQVRQALTLALAHTDQVAALLVALVRQALLEAVTHADQLAALLDAQAHQLASLTLTRIDQVAQQLEAIDRQLFGQAIEFAQAESRAVAADLAAEGERWRSAVHQLDVEGHLLSDQAVARAVDIARALTVPLAAAVTTLEDSPCQQFCSPLGDLGQLLQGLEDAGLAALLVALAADAIHDPEGTARSLTDLLGGPARDAAQLVAGEVGIGRVA